MGAKVELIGISEMLSHLQQMSEKAAKVENLALKAGGEILAAEMRSLVPVSTVKHKHIRDDIEVSGVRTKDGVKFVEVGPGKETNWRAKFVEFGTSKMNAKPFIEPAYLHKKDEAIEALATVITEALGL